MRTLKIVYSTSSHLRYGGLEIVTSIKAESLSTKDGCLVWLVNSEKLDVLPPTISNKITEVDLGTPYNSITTPFPLNLLARARMMLKHKKALKAFLDKIQPDIVISVGEDKFFLPYLRGPWKTIREIHYPKYNRQKYAAGTFILSLISRLGDYLEYDVVCKKYDCVVVLTQEDLNTNWKGRKNVYAIPNPTRFHPDVPSRLNEKRILAVGRLSHEKNFSSLVRAFSIVAKRFPSWRLDIYGEGDDYPSLVTEINDLGLSDIICLRGNTTDIEKEMLTSSIFVASSKYEGFSLALVEAMACGLPVVSYSCPYGPKEIIQDGKNGFLVPVDDETSLAEKICLLIADDDLRSRMGVSAFERAKAFSLETITRKWLFLFNNLTLEQ